MNLMIIPDAHVHPDYNNERFRAVGRLLMEEQPECVVCLGDLADLPSLSSYDRGTKGFEGRRYKKDVQSAIEAQELLFEEMNRFNARKRRNGKKQYRPRLVMCLGNHEDRITRAINSQAELDGTIGVQDLQYEGFGWEVIPFKKCVTIEGIAFSHYFTTGVSGRPISSTHIGHTLVTKLHCSAVQGHSHLYNHAEHTRPDGQKIFGLSAGCFSHPDYSESWCMDTEHQWWRGVVILEDLDGEGYYDGVRTVTLRKIMKKYS